MSDTFYDVEQANDRIQELLAEIATLRQERDALQLEHNVVALWELEHQRAEAAEAENARLRAAATEIENKFFVAGQMDAQGHEAEKRRIGSGWPVLALSKRLLTDARALLAPPAETDHE